jgi:hypothetical protein
MNYFIRDKREMKINKTLKVDENLNVSTANFKR